MDEATNNGNSLLSSCLVSNIQTLNGSISDCSNGVVKNEVSKEKGLTRHVFGFVFSESYESRNSLDLRIIEQKKSNKTPKSPVHNNDNSMSEEVKVGTPNKENDQDKLDISVASQVADQSILSSTMSTASPLRTTHNILSPSKHPRLMKSSHPRDTQVDNKVRGVSNQFSRDKESCDIPPDHITDRRLESFYPEYKKSEKEKLNSFQSAVKNEFSQYNEFKNTLVKKRKPIAFSRYEAHIERLDVKPKTSKLRPHNESIAIKKFHGSKQVNTIYTNTNCIQSIFHSFIVKYPLSSDPFDITCISVMTFLLFCSIHS